MYAKKFIYRSPQFENFFIKEVKEADPKLFSTLDPELKLRMRALERFAATSTMDEKFDVLSKLNVFTAVVNYNSPNMTPLKDFNKILRNQFNKNFLDENPTIKNHLHFVTTTTNIAKYHMMIGAFENSRYYKKDIDWAGIARANKKMHYQVDLSEDYEDLRLVHSTILNYITAGKYLHLAHGLNLCHVSCLLYLSVNDERKVLRTEIIKALIPPFRMRQASKCLLELLNRNLITRTQSTGGMKVSYMMTPAAWNLLNEVKKYVQVKTV